MSENTNRNTYWFLAGVSCSSRKRNRKKILQYFIEEANTSVHWWQNARIIILCLLIPIASMYPVVEDETVNVFSSKLYWGRWVFGTLMTEYTNHNYVLIPIASMYSLAGDETANGFYSKHYWRRWVFGTFPTRSRLHGSGRLTLQWTPACLLEYSASVEQVQC